MLAISARDLRKDSGDIRAVDDVSFEVDHGEVYALLGHNGAGKSTTVEAIDIYSACLSGASAEHLADRVGVRSAGRRCRSVSWPTTSTWTWPRCRRRASSPRKEHDER